MSSKSCIDSFARARQEKRQLFQQQWNHFAQSPLFLSSLIFLSIAFILFAVFSGGFIREQAIALRIIGQKHPLWCEFVIAGLQLLIAVPEVLFALGLWKIRTQTRWQEDNEPNFSGFRILKWVNYAICIITGIMLAMYPTIIVAAGEYLKEDELIRLFYLLLSSTLLFVLCVTLVRIILRTAEENITCCWANSRFVLLLTVICVLLVPVILLFAPLSQPFYIALAVLSGGFSYLLFIYWRFLHKTAAAMNKIDHTAISSRENPDDPYHRY